MSNKYFLVSQSSYTSKDGVKRLLTLLVDEKGNPVVSTSVSEIDVKQLPKLPEVKVVMEAGTVFDGRISARITGIEFLPR